MEEGNSSVNSFLEDYHRHFFGMLAILTQILTLSVGYVLSEVQ